jgi:unsaturated rhamnogalacturonyl hydrolase
MAVALKATQLNGTWDGYWPPSLLAPSLIPFPESSGSAFFTAGFAWGIHKGLLDCDDYLPTVERAWKALLRAQTDDGRLGYVQQIGFEPGQTASNDTQLYGSGGFLQAASQVLLLSKKSVGAP